ncbi:MAG TPA: glycosyltransferase family 4 protein [bacterium]|jgi:glycosyltransferase involved in cell wall biosynthesis|nr:glycosyltransferase family 4 protein [bacterium]HOG38139.1 glycosyltransferase family 4 protein [bacterium]
MQILVVGNDKNIFNENSKLLERILEYSKIVEKYFVVVPNNKSVNINKDNLHIFSFGGRNKFTQIIKLFFGTIKIFKKERFNLISVQDQYYLAFIAYLLSKKLKTGLEIQIHGFEKYYGLRKFIANIVIPRANSIRVVSERLKKEIIEKFKISEDKITVVPIYTKSMVLDLGIRAERKKFVFLTIGRLVKVKNIELQIRALKKIVEKYQNIELHIVGEGPEKNNLEKLAEDLNLKNYVKFFGYQNNVEKFYQNCDVFLLTSNYEGWGLVAIEALQYKIPIIMTDVGCANEIIINNENAIIIPVNNLKLLENAMIQIYEDRVLREKFSNNTQIAVSKLLTKEQTLDLYKKSWEKAIL